MDNKLEIKTYVSNFIPELGYLTHEEKGYLIIQSVLAEKAAVKLLQYEGNYLPGKIEVIYKGKVFSPDLTVTDDLLDLWYDLSIVLNEHASSACYNISLLDYPYELTINKEIDRYQFVFKEQNTEAINKSDTFTKEELLGAIDSGFKIFVNFVKSDTLKFGEETIIEEFLKK